MMTPISTWQLIWVNKGKKQVELERGGRNASDFDDKNHQRISFPWILIWSFHVLFNATNLNIEIISNVSLSFWKFLPWERSQIANGWGTLIGSSPLFVINSADEFHTWKYIFIMQIIPRLHSNGLVGYFITFTLRTCKKKKKRFEVSYIFPPWGEKRGRKPNTYKTTAQIHHWPVKKSECNKNRTVCVGGRGESHFKDRQFRVS